MIKSVKKATDILTIIGGCRDGVSLETISRETNTCKSTCVHILQTLCAAGFVTHISRRGGYQLGPFVYYLTQNRRFRQDLIQLCNPVMAWLNKRTDETVLLSILYEEYKLIIHRIEGKHKLSNSDNQMIKGIVYPTATGRMLLAHMSEQELQKLFSKLGLPREQDWRDIHSYADMKQALAKIRAEGYVRVTEDSTVVGYACELHNPQGTVGGLGMAVSVEGSR